MTRTAPACLLAIGLALILLDILAASLHVPGQLGIGSNRLLREFVVLMGVEGALYGVAVLIVRRATLPARGVVAIIGLAFAMRGVVLATPPFLSTDIHRYVWDGMVQNAGINPYRYKPDAPRLAFLRRPAIYHGLNRKHTARTIYPPVAEAIFALATRASPTILAMRLAMTGFDIIAILALLALLRLARRPLSWILIYAWHPLPVWEFAGNGHVDAIVVGFTALALLAAARLRPSWAAAAFTGAVLAKFLPLAMMPALWKPDNNKEFFASNSQKRSSFLKERTKELLLLSSLPWRFPLVMLALIIAFYALYADAGMHVLGFLPGYVHQEGIASGLGIFWLLALNRLIALPPVIGTLYFASAAVVLAALGLRVWLAPPPADPLLRTRSIAADAGFLAAALMLVITPHYPWYFAWLLVPLCVQPNPAGLYLTASAFLLYLDPVHSKLLWPALVFIPPLALGAWSRKRRRATHPCRNCGR